MFTASLGVFLFGLLLAVAGGALGAGIGGNYAFVITGLMVLASWGVFAATGSSFGLDYIAFGPFIGPHIGFASGVGAATYAYYRGYMEDGKDVNSPLAGLGRPDVLLVGSAFGVGGYLLQSGISLLPWFGTNTDSVALTVLISNIAARVIFGGAPGRGMFRGSTTTPEQYNPAKGFMAKIRPGDTTGGHWLEWQERPRQFMTIGAMFGMAAAGVALMLAANVGAHLTKMGLDNSLAASNAPSFAFGVSAVIILFLITNRNMPVQHHMTIIAGLAAVKFYPILMGKGFTWTATAEWGDKAWMMAMVAVLIGGLFAIMSASIGELAARLWYNRGSSHIDPPAASIWISNTIVVSLAALLA